MSWSLKIRTLALSAMCVATAISVTPPARGAEAKTLRFAFQGELKSVDPY